MRALRRSVLTKAANQHVSFGQFVANSAGWHTPVFTSEAAESHWISQLAPDPPAVSATLSMEATAHDAEPIINRHLKPGLTKVGTAIGSPLYMAPEVWRGSQATERSDVYSLAVILFELCSGLPPHFAGPLEELGNRVMQRNAPNLAASAPSVDARLARVIDRCLRLNPAQRFATGEELCVELERLDDRLTLGRRLIVASVMGLGLALALSIAGNVIYGWALTRKAISAHVNDGLVALQAARQTNTVVEDLRTRAFAKFDNQLPTEGERLWSTALASTQKSFSSYQLATKAFDKARSLDPQRQDVRHQLAEVLYEQAILFDRDHQDTQRDEMLDRLASHASSERDDFLMRWKQPGQISLSTTPVDAVVEVRRYQSDSRGRLTDISLGTRGTTPLPSLALEPGSYLLVMTAPGRRNVRLPLLVGRGESMNLKIYLPRLAEIPANFCYVPPGRFLFGKAGNESVRTKIFRSVPPLHEVITGPYLIAQNETTFEDWLRFLAALPEDKRRSHIPRGDGSSAQGPLELRQDAAGIWTLTLRPTPKQQHVARLGELIEYEKRSSHRTVDWRRLPVVGIDVSDALEYVKWLDQTGKVPRARLCTEYEWERAARGSDAREYPHGDVLDPDDANIDETYATEDLQPLSMGPDEVGWHDKSRSPFGVDDLSGNVWEWTSSSLEHNRFALRGGAYYFDVLTAQVNNRQRSEPTQRDHRLGLRICADLPSQ